MEGYLKPTIFVCSQKEPDLKFFWGWGYYNLYYPTFFVVFSEEVWVIQRRF